VWINLLFAVVNIDHVLVAVPYFPGDFGVLHSFVPVLAEDLVKRTRIIALLNLFGFVLTLHALESVEPELLFLLSHPHHQVAPLNSNGRVLVTTIFFPKPFQGKDTDGAELGIASSRIQVGVRVAGRPVSCFDAAGVSCRGWAYIPPTRTTAMTTTNLRQFIRSSVEILGSKACARIPVFIWKTRPARWDNSALFRELASCA
jgi:hypothetical protein